MNGTLQSSTGIATVDGRIAAGRRAGDGPADAGYHASAARVAAHAAAAALLRSGDRPCSLPLSLRSTRLTPTQLTIWYRAAMETALASRQACHEQPARFLPHAG